MIVKVRWGYLSEMFQAQTISPNFLSIIMKDPVVQDIRLMGFDIHEICQAYLVERLNT